MLEPWPESSGEALGRKVWGGGSGIGSSGRKLWEEALGGSAEEEALGKTWEEALRRKL